MESLIRRSPRAAEMQPWNYTRENLSLKRERRISPSSAEKEPYTEG
jgi:hypothetical protein